MSLLNKSDKISVTSSNQAIADHYAGKIKIFLNIVAEFGYNGETFSIKSIHNSGYASIDSSVLNDMYKRIGKMSTIKSDIDMRINVNESIIIPNHLNVYVPDGDIELYPSFRNMNDNVMSEIHGINIKAKNLNIIADQIHISKVNIQVKSLQLTCDSLERMINNINGNITTEKIIYMPPYSHHKLFLNEVGIIDIMNNPNNPNWSKINPIKQSGLDIYNIRTHIFTDGNEYICITKDINKYFQPGRTHVLADGWYLMQTNSIEIFDI